MYGEQFPGSVCTDCLMVITNADSSGIQDISAWEKRVCEKNPTENGRYSVVPLGNSENYFSKCSCDYCGISLAGNRQDVIFEDTWHATDFAI